MIDYGKWQCPQCGAELRSFTTDYIFCNLGHFQSRFPVLLHELPKSLRHGTL